MISARKEEMALTTSDGSGKAIMINDASYIKRRAKLFNDLKSLYNVL